jgi:hypothetical protein
MNASTLPTELSISRQSAITLAIESWRLNRIAALLSNAQEGTSLRYAARQFSQVLSEMNIEIVDMVGLAYDPGMVPVVVDVHDDPKLGEGAAFIDETVSPTVMWRGQVVEAGQVSLRRGHSVARSATTEGSR